MIITHDRRATINEVATEMDRRGKVIEELEARISRIEKVKIGYADQARFADIDCAVHFREFVRRIDAAIAA